MRKHLALTAAALVAFSTVAASPQALDEQAAADHSVELVIGDAVTVQGNQGIGTNANYFTDYVCSSDPHTYCETTLVKLTNEYEEENAKKGRERANLALNFTPTIPLDFDLALFESDADGTQGSELGRSGTTPIVDCESGCESINAVVTTTEDSTEVYVLVHVVYFAAVGDYTLDISFTQ